MARMAGVQNFLDEPQGICPSSVSSFATSTSLPTITLDLTREPPTQLSLRSGGSEAVTSKTQNYMTNQFGAQAGASIGHTGLMGLAKEMISNGSNSFGPEELRLFQFLEKSFNTGLSISSGALNAGSTSTSYSQARQHRQLEQELSARMAKFVFNGQQGFLPPGSQLLDPVGAATAVNTADPTFTAALAAAITSMISQSTTCCTRGEISLLDGSVPTSSVSEPNDQQSAQSSDVSEAMRNLQRSVSNSQVGTPGMMELDVQLSMMSHVQQRGPSMEANSTKMLSSNLEFRNLSEQNQ